MALNDRIQNSFHNIILTNKTLKGPAKLIIPGFILNTNTFWAIWLIEELTVKTHFQIESSHTSENNKYTQYLHTFKRQLFPNSSFMQT